MKKLLIALLSFFALVNGTEKSQEYFYISLPGQNGAGCDSYLGNNIVTDDDNYSHCPTIKSWRIDLGQGNCIASLKKELSEKQNRILNKKLILCGVSQATATFTNYVASLTRHEQEKKIGALVLESVLGHGNSAILHTAANIPYITYLPFSRFWIPRIGRLLFPTYNPFGMQAIQSAKKISPNIPVIIMHHHKDPQLSINDARQLYCVLKKNGNDKTYLLEINNNFRSHFDILDSYYDQPHLKQIKLNAIQAIYKKQNLPHTSFEDIDQFDLTPYTPSIQEVERRIYDSTWKSRYLRNAIDITSGSLILGYLGYKYLK
jgi:hypothetical protein